MHWSFKSSTARENSSRQDHKEKFSNDYQLVNFAADWKSRTTSTLTHIFPALRSWCTLILGVHLIGWCSRKPREGEPRRKWLCYMNRSRDCEKPIKVTVEKNETNINERSKGSLKRNKSKISVPWHNQTDKSNVNKIKDAHREINTDVKIKYRLLEHKGK